MRSDRITCSSVDTRSRVHLRQVHGHATVRPMSCSRSKLPSSGLPYHHSICHFTALPCVLHTAACPKTPHHPTLCATFFRKMCNAPMVGKLYQAYETQRDDRNVACVSGRQSLRGGQTMNSAGFSPNFCGRFDVPQYPILR